MKVLLKFLLALGIIAAFSISVNAQIRVLGGGMYGTTTKYETLDSAVLKVLYEVKLQSEQSLMESKDSVSIDTDYMVLEIGETGISRYYSDNKRKTDSLMAEMLKKSNSVRLNTEFLKENGISSMGNTLEIFKNYPAGKMTVTDNIITSSYLYEEPMDEFAWEITTDTMTCLQYVCQKAVCDFRGRHYEAWFAPELPINNGPWKFSGLPGLILSVATADGLYSFKAIGLENYEAPVQFAKKTFIKASRKDFEKVKRRSIEDMAGSLSNLNSSSNMKVEVRVQTDSGGTRSLDEVRFVYHPMEID